MSRFKHMVRITCAVAFALLFLGCAKANGQAARLDESGKHPANWVDQHWIEFNKNPAQCTSCHGSASDAAASGGIAKVTCFACHHKTGPKHPTGWKAAAQHGTQGAMALPGLGTGMTHCAVCHGSDYRDAAALSVSCYQCHKKAPHPDKPWHGVTASGSPSDSNHAATDPGNAAACAQCHSNGANSDLKPPTPVVAAPGCYNNTLCHGNNPGHVVGWSLASMHGRGFAQAAPGAVTGFAYCVTCHGSTYSNGVATSCLTCHTKAPHPNAPWNGATAASVRHTATDPGNAPECFKCHVGGNNSTLKPVPPAPAGTAPGCFNNTMCHGTGINR